MEECVLQVDKLCKHYGERCVVNHLSFSINRGECFGLLGHNGAGKSTTLECILQVRKAEEGSVRLLGHELHGKDKKLFERISVQFQESGYPDKMKVREACELTASMYRNTGDWESMLADFHLERLRNQTVSELSGGERQRLSVLLAMLPKPDILFLDELTTGLDAQVRREIWKYILEYKKRGNSLLLTSHYMDEVERLCDRIGILKEGSLIFIGTVEQAKAKAGCGTLEEAYLWFHGEVAE